MARPFALFTVEERDLLTKAGWEVKQTVAYNNYHKIVKLGDTEIEVETWVDGDAMDNANYWEWDSTWPTVERAVRYCVNRT